MCVLRPHIHPSTGTVTCSDPELVISEVSDDGGDDGGDDDGDDGGDEDALTIAIATVASSVGGVSLGAILGAMVACCIMKCKSISIGRSSPHCLLTEMRPAFTQVAKETRLMIVWN